MRIKCPLCGERDMREFYFKGADLPRPETDQWGADWDDYLHNRDNPAGDSRELWHHHLGCSAWLIVTRNTVSHTVLSVVLAREEVRDAG